MPHISFAAGEHTCLGLHLARLETRVALECLLSRLTNVNLLADSDPAHPRPAVPLADGSSDHVRRKVKEDRVVLKW